MVANTLSLALAACLCTQADPPSSSRLTAPGATLERLWHEGEFTEGPAAAPDGSIYFSDIGDRILRFDPKTKQVAEFRNPSGRSNGLIFDSQGRLIAVEGANAGGNRRVTRTEKDATIRVLADRFDGHRFNSPNDVTLDTRGRVYFSDPRYVGSEPRELDFEGVFRIDADGSVHRVETGALKPNGLAFSPDGKTLYVADNGEKRRVILAVSVDPAADKVPSSRVLVDFAAERGADGLTVTRDGLIVAAAGGGDASGVHVFTPKGERIAFLRTPETATNVEFAGPDYSTLYITAGTGLYRIATKLHGVPAAYDSTK